MKKGESTNKKTRVIMAILRTADILNRYLEIELAKYGSSPIRFGVMNTLFVHGGKMTPTDISRWTFRTNHTITSMLNVLEKAGLIRREPNKDDGRSVNILITEKGWKGSDKMIPVAERMSKRALKSFDDRQLEALEKLLKELRKSLLKEIGLT